MAAVWKRFAYDAASTVALGVVGSALWLASDYIDTADLAWVTDKAGRSYIQNTGGHDVRINAVSFPNAPQPPLYVAGTILCPLASVKISDIPKSPLRGCHNARVQYQCMTLLGRSLVKEETLTLTECMLPLPPV